jgi:hypothetical protein
VVAQEARTKASAIGIATRAPLFQFKFPFIVSISFLIRLKGQTAEIPSA